jgi:hypothetical protein
LTETNQEQMDRVYLLMVVEAGTNEAIAEAN